MPPCWTSTLAALTRGAAALDRDGSSASRAGPSRRPPERITAPERLDRQPRCVVGRSSPWPAATFGPPAAFGGGPADAAGSRAATPSPWAVACGGLARPRRAASFAGDSPPAGGPLTGFWSVAASGCSGIGPSVPRFGARPCGCRRQPTASGRAASPPGSLTSNGQLTVRVSSARRNRRASPSPLETSHGSRRAPSRGRTHGRPQKRLPPMKRRSSPDPGVGAVVTGLGRRQPLRRPPPSASPSPGRRPRSPRRAVRRRRNADARRPRRRPTPTPVPDAHPDADAGPDPGPRPGAADRAAGPAGRPPRGTRSR